MSSLDNSAAYYSEDELTLIHRKNSMLHVPLILHKKKEMEHDEIVLFFLPLITL